MLKDISFTHVSIYNYRCILNLKLSLGKRLTILTGEAESGRSTILQGIAQGLLGAHCTGADQCSAFARRGVENRIHSFQTYTSNIAFDKDTVLPNTDKKKLVTDFIFDVMGNDRLVSTHHACYTKSSDAFSSWELDELTPNLTIKTLHDFKNLVICKPTLSSLTQIKTNEPRKTPIIQSNGDSLGTYMKFMWETRKTTIKQLIETIAIAYPALTDIIVDGNSGMEFVYDKSIDFQEFETPVVFRMHNGLVPSTSAPTGLIASIMYFLLVSAETRLVPNLILIDDIDEFIPASKQDLIIEQLVVAAEEAGRQLVISTRMTKLVNNLETQVHEIKHCNLGTYCL